MAVCTAPVPVSPPQTTDKLPVFIWRTFIEGSRRLPWPAWAAAVLLLAVTAALIRNATQPQVSGGDHTAPLCNLTTVREALSAIKRAETAFCKFQIEKFACALQKGTVYPESLPSFCPSEKPVKDTSTLSSRPNTVRILFVLTVHGRDTRQVRRLLQLIYRPEHYFLIHVDKRSEFLFGQLLPLEEILPNLKLLRKRHSPIWGGASLLTALLDAVRFGLEHAHWHDWDYFLNLSEADLPIKSNDELVEYLARHFGSNFAKSHGTSAEKFIKRQGLDESFFECEERMWRVGVRHLPAGITIDGGSDWVVLHRHFCQYLLDDASSELLTGLRVVFNHTLLPAESFFHTVLHNSQFCHTYRNNNLRLTNWRRKKGCNCQYKHIVDWCGCSPNVFRKDDIQKILSYSPRPIFFARKFDPFVDLKVINMVLADLRASSSAENRNLRLEEIPPTWTRHWLNLHTSSETHSSKVTETIWGSLLRLCTWNQPLTDQQSTKVSGGQLLSVHVTVDLYGKRNLLLAQAIPVESGGRAEVVESLIGFREKFRRHPTAGDDGPGRRILNLEVSTDFDQKEEMFRNYPLAHGPYCDPALAYNVSAGEDVLLSVVWLDPADVVAGSFELNLTAEAQVGLHTPEFKKPLRPGVWTVYLMYKWRVIASTKFLILPLVSSETLDNLGPERNAYIDYNFTSVAQLFPSLRPVKKKREADVNASKTGSDLAVWIDQLVADFYSVDDVCVVVENEDKVEDLLSKRPSPCQKTPWSSFSPDDSQIFPIFSVK